jgi:hypothetical protein
MLGLAVGIGIFTPLFHLLFWQMEMSEGFFKQQDVSVVGSLFLFLFSAWVFLEVKKTAGGNYFSQDKQKLQEEEALFASTQQPGS